MTSTSVATKARRATGDEDDASANGEAVKFRPRRTPVATSASSAATRTRGANDANDAHTPAERGSDAWNRDRSVRFAEGAENARIRTRVLRLCLRRSPPAPASPTRGSGAGRSPRMSRRSPRSRRARRATGPRKSRAIPEPSRLRRLRSTRAPRTGAGGRRATPRKNAAPDSPSLCCAVLERPDSARAAASGRVSVRSRRARRRGSRLLLCLKPDSASTGVDVRARSRRDGRRWSRRRSAWRTRSRRRGWSRGETFRAFFSRKKA